MFTEHFAGLTRNICNHNRNFFRESRMAEKYAEESRFCLV
jgi:hypothetical protein